MRPFDIGHVWGERVAGLKGCAPDQAGFETNHMMVVIVDFDDLQIMPIFASAPTMRTVFTEDFQ